MISNSLGRTSSLTAVIAFSSTSVNARPHRHEQKAHVRFLATITLIRGTWGPNEDTYVAELSVDKDKEHALIRLIDAYPNEVPPTSRAELTATSGVALRVRRDFDCNRSYGLTILHTAPNDPLAILSERLEYQPQLDWTPQAGAILPCYRTMRR